MLREQLLSKTEMVNVPIDLSAREEISHKSISSSLAMNGLENSKRYSQPISVAEDRYDKEFTRGHPNPVEV